MTGRLTVITAETPSTLGKTFKLDQAGKLVKTTAGQLARGRYEVREFDDAAALAELLATVSVNQAICSSTPTNGSPAGALVSKALLPQTPGAIARTKTDFGFSPQQRGCLILDYDPPASGAMSQAELWTCLRSVVPGVANAGVVWWASGSSHIWANETELQGLKGQRLYLMMADAAVTCPLQPYQ